jgi:hypothetical protein
MMMIIIIMMIISVFCRESMDFHGVKRLFAGELHSLADGQREAVEEILRQRRAYT